MLTFQFYGITLYYCWQICGWKARHSRLALNVIYYCRLSILTKISFQSIPGRLQIIRKHLTGLLQTLIRTIGKLSFTSSAILTITVSVNYIVNHLGLYIVHSTTDTLTICLPPATTVNNNRQNFMAVKHMLTSLAYWLTLTICGQFTGGKTATLSLPARR